MGKSAKALALLVLWGCGHQGAAIHEPGQPSAVTGKEPGAEAYTALPIEAHGWNCCQSCPVALPGVKVDYGMSGGGAVMVFTTPEQADEVELRRRVAELAELHNRRSDKLAMITLPHRAEMRPIERGARLDLVPIALNTTNAFQTQVEREVAWMREGHCPPIGEENECDSCELRRPRAR